MNEALGPRNALAAEDDDKAAGTEVNLGYDPLWVPTGLLGKYSGVSNKCAGWNKLTGWKKIPNL